MNFPACNDSTLKEAQTSSSPLEYSKLADPEDIELFDAVLEFFAAESIENAGPFTENKIPRCLSLPSSLAADGERPAISALDAKVWRV